MDEQNIRNYAKLMQDLDLTALELREDGATLRLERSPTATQPVAVPVLAPVRPSDEPAPPVFVEDPYLVNIASPMVGVFYAAAAENQPTFVSVGDTIRRGDVLCIIESMKLMNEITSEYDGVVIEICVGNQQVVDYGHPLFRIRKEAL